MKSDNDADNVTHPPRGVSRRTLVKGAAWSVPAVAVAVAAPIASASMPCAGSGSKTFTAPSSSSPRSLAFTVPAGVTELSYVVAGGAGGSVRGSSGDQVGGQGGQVTGTLPVSPGEVLDIFVGQGGESTPSDVNGPVQRAGGRGYGDGGNAGAPAGDTSPSYVKWNSGAAGGGGSAIVRGSSPLVVAGGGGGGPADWIVGQNISVTSRPSGGSAGSAGGGWGFSGTGGGGQSARVNGGESGVTGAGGAGGTYSGGFPSPPVIQPGHDGRTASGSVGGDGGDSFGGGVAHDSGSGWEGWSASGGGGGGGYGGGGGGEAEWASTDTQGGVEIIGGGGGGGTSYIAPGITGSIGLSGSTATPDDRVDGYVQISWQCT